MSRSQKRYSKEFKLEAIGLADSLGNTKEAARQLGISDSLIYAWRSRLKDSPPGSNPGKSLSEVELENQRLRKENIELKKVNHILKAAAAFFSQDHLK